MGDAKEKVRDEAQNLALKLMDEVAPPMVGLHLNEEFSNWIDGNYSKLINLQEA